jgi:hypothetical protein
MNANARGAINHSSFISMLDGISFPSTELIHFCMRMLLGTILYGNARVATGTEFVSPPRLESNMTLLKVNELDTYIFNNFDKENSNRMLQEYEERPRKSDKVILPIDYKITFSQQKAVVAEFENESLESRSGMRLGQGKKGIAKDRREWTKEEAILVFSEQRGRGYHLGSTIPVRSIRADRHFFGF